MNTTNDDDPRGDPVVGSAGVLFVVSGDREKASSRVRAWWIADELTLLGYRCRFVISGTKSAYVRVLSLIPSHDIIVFQKTYSKYDVLLMRLARRLGKQVYFDIDDAPSRANIASTTARAEQMMRLADRVWAGSAELVKLAETAGANVHLVPSGIRLENYTMREPRSGAEPVTLGWIGNGAHYASDLVTVLLPVLDTLSADLSFRLKLVGACGDAVLHRQFAQGRPYDTELVDTVDWSDPRAVATATEPFDIGLYPLILNDFNRYKCGFKALEYMAWGIPFVASDQPGNVGIMSDGQEGFLVSSHDEWIDRLSNLIKSGELRTRIGRNGRARVETSFSTKRIAERLSQDFAEHDV